MACATALPTSSESSACNATAESSENSAIPNQSSADGEERVKARPVPDLIYDPILPNRRLSYTREEKLHVLKFYRESGDNKYKTCQRFGVPKASLYRWIECEDEIRKSREGSKRIEGGGRRAFWPDVEERLAAEFKELRQKGQNLTHQWFRVRAHQLMTELHPEVKFCFSPGWFDRFKARNDITRHRIPKSYLVNKESMIVCEDF